MQERNKFLETKAELDEKHTLPSTPTFELDSVAEATDCKMRKGVELETVTAESLGELASKHDTEEFQGLNQD